MLKGGISISETWLCGFPQVTQGSSAPGSCRRSRVDAAGGSAAPVPWGTGVGKHDPSHCPSHGDAISQPKHVSCCLESKACGSHSAPAEHWLAAPCQGCVLSPDLCCVSCVLPEPALAGTAHRGLCIGKSRLLEDCDYPSLNRTSTPEAVFKTKPWSFPQLPCQWKPQERQICFFQCNF